MFRLLNGRKAKIATNVPELFMEQRKQVLEQLRLYAVVLCKRNGSATVDEVRAEFIRVNEGWPSHINPNIFTSVFNTRDFINMGYERGTRMISGQRPVVRWKLR